MGSNLLQYPGKDSGEYPPRHELDYYDVERALNRRYQQHQAQLAWSNRLANFTIWIVNLEKRLFHGPALRAHPKLATIHRHHRR